MIEHKNHKHRNPFIVTPMGNFLQAIGDTHLGRVFKNDVRLERRGDYEAQQIEELRKLLDTEKPELNKGNFAIFQAGDWFDKPVVNLAVIMKSAEMLNAYAHKQASSTNFVELVVISGNHDDAKNVSDVTAWDVLARTMAESIHNMHGSVRFIKDYYVKRFDNGEEILFIGWNITTNACKALLAAIEDGYKSITTVVCHLDKISYGNDDNVIPYEFFAQQGIKMVISGHEHKPYYFYDQGMEVIGTGSLLPYSHAEDDGEEIYVTLHSINEFEEYAQEHNIHGKHIRLILDEADQERVGELKDVNTLSLKIVKKGVDVAVLDMDAVDEVHQVNIQAYDAKSVWENTVAETALCPVVGKLIWQEIEAKGTEE